MSTAVSVALILVAASYIGLCAIGFWIIESAADRQTWIVFVTGLALLWYSWETMRLRQIGASQLRAAERQQEAMLREIELQIRPFVVIDPGSQLGLHNIGPGTALSVRIADVPLPNSPVILRMVPAGQVSPGAALDRVAYLEPGHRINFEIVPHVADKRLGSNMLAAHLDPQWATFRLPVQVLYEDVEGKPYVLEHIIARGEITLHTLKAEE